MIKILIIVMFFGIIGCNDCDDQNGNSSGEIIFTSLLDSGIPVAFRFDPSSLFQDDIADRAKIYDINSEFVLYISESEDADTLFLMNFDGSNKREIFTEFGVFVLEEPRISDNSRFVYFKSYNNLFALDQENGSLSSIANDLSLKSTIFYKDNQILYFTNSNLIKLISEDGTTLFQSQAEGEILDLAINSSFSEISYTTENNNEINQVIISTGEIRLISASESYNLAYFNDDLLLFDKVGSISRIEDDFVRLVLETNSGEMVFVNYSDEFESLQLSFLNTDSEIDLYYLDKDYSSLELISNNGFRAFRN